MTTFEYTNLIKHLILNERSAYTQFRKNMPLNRAGIEILTFAEENLMFNVYQIVKYFKHTNVQVVRRSVKFLISESLIECVGIGKGHNASVYMITKKGQSCIEGYMQLWMKILPFQF